MLSGVPPPPVVRLVLQLFTNDHENITPVFVASRTPHVTGIVVLVDDGAVHEPVFDDDHVPVPDRKSVV